MKSPTDLPEPEQIDAGSADPTPAVAGAPADGADAFDLTTSAPAMALAELRRLLAAWRRHEPGARLGEDPEELHQLRVTARRIDATLGLFKRQLPAALVRARKPTKAILRSLGAARDLDVELSELADYCAHLPEEERPQRLRGGRSSSGSGRGRGHAWFAASTPSPRTAGWRR